jgi:hypothetical protein
LINIFFGDGSRDIKTKMNKLTMKKVELNKKIDLFDGC